MGDEPVPDDDELPMVPEEGNDSSWNISRMNSMISDASDLLNTETSDTESRDAIKNGLKTLTHVLNQEIKNI